VHEECGGRWERVHLPCGRDRMEGINGGHDRDRPPARAHPHKAVSWPRHGKEDHLNLTN
jgi:hypothetical protein